MKETQREEETQREGEKGGGVHAIQGFQVHLLWGIDPGGLGWVQLFCVHVSVNLVITNIVMGHCTMYPHIYLLVLKTTDILLVKGFVFNTHCYGRAFPDAFTLRCFAFEPSDAQVEEDKRDKVHLMMFPPTTDTDGEPVLQCSNRKPC